MRQIKLVLSTVFVLLAAGCAVKPDDKVAAGQDDNLFRKSEVLGRPVAEAQTGPIFFDGLAKPKAELNATQKRLIKSLDKEGMALTDDDEVSFTISETYLTVNRISAGKTEAAAQFKVEGHFDLVNQKNPDGVETQYLGRDQSKNGRWQDREFIAVNPADPLPIKASDKELKNLYPVAELQGKKLTLKSVSDLAWVTPSDRAELVELFGLKAGDTVMTTLSRTRLSLFKVDGDGGLTIMAHVDVKYFDLQRQEDDEGELSPDLERNTDAEWSKRAFVEVDPGALKIAKPGVDLMKNLFVKSDFDGKTYVLGKDTIPVVSLSQEVSRILASGLVSVSKGDKLKLVVTKEFLNVFKGDALVLQYAVTHYDVGPTEDAEGEVTAAISLLQDRPLTERKYVKLDPNDPLPIFLSDTLVTESQLILEKSDLKSGCMLASELPLAVLRDAVATESLPEGAKVCVDVTQTVLSISVQEQGTKRLLVTFDIGSHFDIELAKSPDGEEVYRVLIPSEREINWEKRKHIVLRRSSMEKVDNKVRDNALSKSVLQGQFIYTATVTEAHSENGMVFEGWNLQSPDRLELKLDEQHLTAYKLNEPLNTSGARSPVLRYGVDHFDIGRVENGYGDETHVIAELTDKPWKQRKNLRIDLASNQITSYFNDLLGVEKLYSGVVFTAQSKLAGDIKVEDGMLSFETEEVITPNARADYYGTGETFLEPVALKIKHVFMKVGDRPYVAKEYNDQDFMRFGYFRTTEHGFDPIHGKTDSTLKHYMNRHDISGGKQIHYYLNEGFPEKYKDEAREAIAAWNVAFKAATGRDDVVVLHEDVTKDFADPRHNMIVYIDGMNAMSPLGFGPSVIDPTTGETISAKSYMYGDGMRYIRNVASDYYDLATGVRSPTDFTIHRQLPPVTTDGGVTLSPISRQLHPVAQALPRNKIAAKALKQKGAGGSPLAAGVAMSKLQAHGSAALDAMTAEATPALTALQRAMKDKVLEEQKLSFGSRQQGCVETADQHLASAIKFIEAYPGKTKEELLDEIESRTFFTTLVHELGHNLGLRHNFHGSFDETNFPEEYHLLKSLAAAGLPDPIADGEWIFKYRGSSVMDYSDDFEALSTKAGPYDVAAIKYGYGDILERVVGVDDTGALVTEDISRDDLVAAKEELRAEFPDALETQIDAAAAQRLALRPYLFCTDEHVVNDPTCRRWDRGVTLAESTQSLVEDYETLYYLYGFRRGRRMFTGSSQMALTRFILPVRQLLDEYVYNIIFDGFRSNDPSAAGSQDDFINAINIGIRFYDKILSTLEPGDYHLDPATGELVSGRSAEPDAKNLVVTLREGKYLESRFENTGQEDRVLNRGIELDKIGVVWAMGMRGYPAPKYEAASLSVNYFDLLREFTLDTFSKLIRDDYKIEIAAVKPEGSMDYVPVLDQQLDASDPNVLVAKIKPSTSLALRQYASIFAILGFDSNADRSFVDYMDVRVKGVNDAIPAGTQSVEFTSATGVKTYVVPNTADGMSISFAIGTAAKAASDKLAVLRGTALPDLSPLKAEAIQLFGDAWLLGEGAPMGDDIVAILDGNFDGNMDIMKQLVAQWVETADDPAVKEQLVAVQTALDTKLAEYAVAAQVGGDVQSQIDDLNRELLQHEADLMNLRTLYSILN
jgi:hypothetical protein